MNKDRKIERLSEGLTTNTDSSLLFDLRPERNRGTGRILPSYDLLSRGEGPQLSNEPVDPEKLIKTIRFLAGIKYHFGKPPNRRP